MIFFDYIYYRITQLKLKKESNSEEIAISLVSLLQTFLIECIVQPIFMYFLSKDDLASNSKQLGWLAGIIAIILLVLNYKKYDGKFERYQLYWKNESYGKRFIKGFFVIMCFVLPVIFVILLNNYLHRYNTI